MLRYLGLMALPLLLLAQPAAAVTAKQKMETCKFGAASEHLTGAKRNTFIKRCMAKGNYEPAARQHTMKTHAAKKKVMKKTENMKKTEKKPIKPATTPAPKPQ
jgi:hypothetical protein